MYNRYVGNTGRVYRVQEESDNIIHIGGAGQGHASTVNEPLREKIKSVPVSGGGGLFGKGGILGGLLGGGGKNPLGSGGLRFLDSKLPFGMDTIDLVLIVLFLFLFIESGDEEFLIILAFLAYSIFKDRKD